MFGPAWSAVSLGMLIVGVIWKGLSAGTTMPFAALRRSGDGAVVIAVRLVVTALFIAASLIAVDAVGTVVGVLIGFAISEALSWILFEVAARRFVRSWTGIPARGAGVIPSRSARPHHWPAWLNPAIVVLGFTGALSLITVELPESVFEEWGVPKIFDLSHALLTWVGIGALLLGIMFGSMRPGIVLICEAMRIMMISWTSGTRVPVLSCASVMPHGV